MEIDVSDVEPVKSTDVIGPFLSRARRRAASMDGVVTAGDWHSATDPGSRAQAFAVTAEKPSSPRPAVAEPVARVVDPGPGY